MDYSTFEHDGIILSADLSRGGIDGRQLARAITSGELVRVRRGAFCRAGAWDASDARERHLIRIAAVAALSRNPIVLARESAAAIWGLPIGEFPPDVIVLDRWKGGGRSEPGVRRTSRGAQSAAVVRRGTYHCTTLARTALDVVRGMDFTRAVAVLDWVLWERNPLRISKAELAAEAQRARCSSAVRAAVAFATHLSGSWGESEARAVIHPLGFPPPALQHRFVDEEGEMFADFTWLHFGVAAEFDGKIKYTRDEYTRGDPGEVLWREKLREDRLRRQVRQIVRIVTADVKTPVRLASKLRAAGLRSTRDSIGGGSRLAAGDATPANGGGLPPNHNERGPVGSIRE